MAQTKCLFLTGTFILVLAVGPSNSQTSSVSSSITSYNYGFLNGTSLITIQSSTWDLQLTKEVTFRTCVPNGTFLAQSAPPGTVAGTQSLRLYLQNGTVVFEWRILSGSSTGDSDSSQTGSISVGANLANNQQYTVRLKYYLGTVYLNVTQFGSTALYSAVVANSAYNRDLLNAVIRNTDLQVGEQFVGCLYGGPGVNFNSGVVADNVTWNYCPLQGRPGCSLEDQDGDDCISQPCQNGGTCRDLFRSYACDCPYNFNGTNCEIDLARQFGCQVHPCENNGTCNSLQFYPQGGLPYKCVCLDGFSGRNCEVEVDECKLNPCGTGSCTNLINSYRCDCTGTGFQGENCTEDIDECVVNPCGTGRCFNIPGSYSCDCPAGLDGPTCQDINECVSSPCQNGATCRDGLNNYTCICVPGFTGVNCQVNIDDCANVTCPGSNSECIDLLQDHRCVCKPGYTGNPGACVEIDECASGPCQNGATCQNLINAFQCDCRPGFRGLRCEENIDECASNPCANNATCVDGVNGFTCRCRQGFTSYNCSVNIDDCVGNYCQNGATCVDLVNDYKCTCAPGWTGPTCEMDFDECASSPCQNGATCHNYLAFYNCTCAPGFTGANCEVNINECQPDPCLNGATCEDRVNDYFCRCPPIWMGKTCNETYSACASMPCQNGATCRTDPPSQSYTCSCPVGFTGTNCETNIDDCVTNTCASYQECYDGVNSYTCDCPRGYTGGECSDEIDECASNPCQNEATCVNGIGNYTCLCKEGPANKYHQTGYKGVNCELDIDECLYDPPVCQNGGTCINIKGSYLCSCIGQTPGGDLITGHSCEVVTNYCIASGGNPCRNGATCQSITAGYTCHCVPGYTDKNCSTDINECESNPCQFSSTCNDSINGYTCDCVPGTTGTNCEVNINECASNPCNAGECHDSINSFTCDCFDSGFEGDFCEKNINDCRPDSCVNNATCIDGVKNVTCACFLGYMGLKCEIDIAECDSNPCQNGGSCYEYSDQTLYQSGYFSHSFSYANASGYKCECVLGFRGDNCEENIDDCEQNDCQNGATCHDLINDYQCVCSPGYTGSRCETEINECELYQPCQNGGTCIDEVADYTCRCLEFSRFRELNYGGKNCSVLLTGCRDGNRCMNGYCIPFYVEASNQHDYQCHCNSGFAGRFCDLSTTVTFNASGSEMHYRLNAATRGSESFSLQFRTTLTNVVLAMYVFSEQTFVSLEIVDKDLVVLYRDASSQINQTVDTQDRVNNAEWHQVYVALSQNISVAIVSAACSSERCLKQFSYPRGKPINYDAKSGLYFGRMESDLVVQTLTNRTYVGCMQDVVYNNVYLFPGQQAGVYLGMFPGCPRTTQCFPYTCNRHGTCVDLWDAFQCHCDRPYWGTTCEQEYTVATFNKGGSPSLAVFRLPPPLDSGSDLNFSFFLRTRQDNSSIMYVSNEAPLPNDLTYLTLELQNGFLGARLRLCTYQVYFTNTESVINKGWPNFVQLQLTGSRLTLKVNNTATLNATIDPTSCPLKKYVVGFGAAPNVVSSAGRKRRQASSTVDIAVQDPFNGVIQDIEFQGYKLDFYNRSDTAGHNTVLLSSQQNLVLKAESTESVCNTTEPCENGGTCMDVFFNDFNCSCPPGYLGKNCSQPDFCQDDSCPSGTTCRSLWKGFECVSTASFNGFSSLALYNFSLPNGLPSQEISFKMRTRAYYGAIFETRSNNNFIKVRVWDGTIEVNYLLKDSSRPEVRSEVLRLSQHRAVNDGKWYEVRVSIDSTDTLHLLLMNDMGSIIGEGDKQLTDAVTDLTSLVTSGSQNIYIGDVADSKEQSFQGCLEEFRLGGVLLPFIYHYKMSNNIADQYFSLTSRAGIIDGCPSNDPCQTSMCRNGGRCKDDWRDYVCECPAGFSGQYCQDDVDECYTNNCLNGGVCQDGVGTRTCVCRPGYTGTSCETQTDLCANTSCDLNRSTCIADPSVKRGYTCSCTDDSVTGEACDVPKEQNCSSALCQNGATCFDTTDQNVSAFTCSCAPGYKGPLCELEINYCSTLPCEQGTCRSNTDTQNYTCDCPAGYTGTKCETNIDDCAGVVCQNGGICEDKLDAFFCNCSEGWTGVKCELDVDECARNVCMHGSCHNRSGDYFCDCSNTGYSGQNCETEINECTLDFCVHGNCTDTEGSYKCECYLGYQGQNCSQADCDDVPCDNGGSCFPIEDNTDWECNCLEYYGGRLCEIAGPCVANPCNGTNAERCIQADDFFNNTDTRNNYTCECKPGWQGKDCSDDIDECMENKHRCTNGATCHNTPGNYTCICLPGYTGPYCEVDIDECASNPCRNGGTCVDGNNTFTCNCADTGYNGTMCEENIDECLVNPTICNNGNCTDQPGHYLCSCGSSYLGSSCEYNNPCSVGPCQNGGSCNHTWDENDKNYKFVCDCTGGYSGEKCQQSPQDAGIDIMIIIGPIIAVILIAIIIGVIAFIMVARKKRATRGAYSPSQQETAGSRVELGNVLKKPPEERLI